MFGKFQGTQPQGPPSSQDSLSPARIGKPTNKPPGGTAHACEPCRKRKSRCDGGPGRVCSRCSASRKEQQCVYLGHKPRNIPSQKLVDELVEGLGKHQAVLDRLFPTFDVSQLDVLSRGDLLRLLASSEAVSGADSLKREPLDASHSGSENHSENNVNNVVLEQLNDAANEYDEGSPDIVAESDDVNALGLAVSQYSSYVGSSSVSAALKIIAILCPGVMQQPPLAGAQSPSSSVRSQRADLTTWAASQHIAPQQEAAYVEAYFTSVHPLHPIVNEPQFRHEYATGVNTKRSWLGLLNMVLAMGSIAATTSVEVHHIIFYQRARQALSYDSFGSGSLQTIQALGLMGGLYLHYCNRPNMAVAITGAAIRMAYALGIHRRAPSSNGGLAYGRQDPNNDMEVRRRTWWSLMCLDCWGSTTLGRPSSADWIGPAITVPRPSDEDFEGTVMQGRAQFLAACVRFSTIAAKMQDRLAVKPCLGVSEMAMFDSQLQEAFASLPPQLRTNQPCTRDLLIPRAILKWRFQNARMLLHRPTLLAASLTRKEPQEMSLADQRSISTCRAIAGETIMDITCDWQAEQMCGWSGAWMLFQAVMVPLVSLFYEPHHAETGKWRQSVEMAMRLLLSMQAWSPVAGRSRDVVAQLYDASNGMGAMSMPDLSAWDPQAAFDSQDLWANNLSAHVSEWSNFAFDPAAFG